MDSGGESQYAVCELHGVLDADLLKKGHPIEFFYMETATPILRVGPYWFKGEYEEVLGSQCLFEKVPVDGESQQPAASTQTAGSSSEAATRTQFKYACHTSLKLKFTRIFIDAKQAQVIVIQ